jgi:hypothetical protein
MRWHGSARTPSRAGSRCRCGLCGVCPRCRGYVGSADVQASSASAGVVVAAWLSFIPSRLSRPRISLPALKIWHRLVVHHLDRVVGARIASDAGGGRCFTVKAPNPRNSTHSPRARDVVICSNIRSSQRSVQRPPAADAGRWRRDRSADHRLTVKAASAPGQLCFR